MTECEEVAGAILSKMLQRPKTFPEAVKITKLFMPDEPTQIIDNVAWAILHSTPIRGPEMQFRGPNKP